MGTDTIDIKKYTRKSFDIDAVQVTKDNIEEVASWCQGEVLVATDTEPRTGETYIKVRVHHPLNERQTRAFVGDWVLYAGTGYKVYTTKAFEACFTPVNA